jgi:hypothetical protein
MQANVSEIEIFLGNRPLQWGESLRGERSLD